MTTVFVSGCYDGLHSGHLEFLEHAARLGDRLIVSVASDETARALKREPIIREHDRLRMVQALSIVDEAFISRGAFGNADCFSYVRNLRPQVWLIDSNDASIGAKRELATEVGARIVLDYRPEQGYSTTSIIDSIQERGVRAPDAEVGIARTGGKGMDPRQRPEEGF